jgi:peptide/nickel transport system permease protein
MRAYIVRRLLLAIPTLIIVTMIVFSLVRIIPGSVIDLMIAQNQSSGQVGEGITREEIAHKLGLDQQIWVQYANWVKGAVQGDLGTSVWSTRTVTGELKNRLPVSLELGLMAFIIGQSIAIPLGIYSAIRQDTFGDYLGRSLAIGFIAIPGFWVATLIVVFAARWWHWVPPLQYVPIWVDPWANIRQFILPAVIMGAQMSGTTMRMTRTMMLEVLRQDYIRTAWSKGLRERVVVVRHAMKNALIPVVTIIGMGLPILVGGSVIFENIFCLPGVGQFLLTVMNTRDYLMLSGVNLFIACFVLVCNLGVDITYSFLDPRIVYR